MRILVISVRSSSPPSRHAELGSASTSPQAIARGERWTLKRVQGDGGVAFPALLRTRAAVRRAMPRRRGAATGRRRAMQRLARTARVAAATAAGVTCGALGRALHRLDRDAALLFALLRGALDRGR